MPRITRIKSINSIYHVMIRSISEIDLFKENSDKIKYFSLIKRYQYKYKFKLYAYCLMDNHGHLMIDVNEADISKIMHCVNFCYAQYYNRKYQRYGHVFQDRFKSTSYKLQVTRDSYNYKGQLQWNKQESSICMSRVARIKSINSIYHAMICSISEIDLFKENSDKIKYFSLIKRYQYKYKFKI